MRCVCCARRRQACAGGLLMWKPSTPYQVVVLSCCAVNVCIGTYGTLHARRIFFGCSTYKNRGALGVVTSEESRNPIAVAVPPADFRALSDHTAVAGKSAYSMVICLQTVYHISVGLRGMCTSRLLSAEPNRQRQNDFRRSRGLSAGDESTDS